MFVSVYRCKNIYHMALVQRYCVGFGARANTTYTPVPANGGKRGNAACDTFNYQCTAGSESARSYFFSRAKHIMGHFGGFFEGAETFFANFYLFYLSQLPSLLTFPTSVLSNLSVFLAFSSSYLPFLLPFLPFHLSSLLPSHLIFFLHIFLTFHRPAFSINQRPFLFFIFLAELTTVHQLIHSLQ